MWVISVKGKRGQLEVFAAFQVRYDGGLDLGGSNGDDKRKVNSDIYLK